MNNDKIEEVFTMKLTKGEECIQIIPNKYMEIDFNDLVSGKGNDLCSN